MPAKRSLGTTQSLTFIGALLLTTAFTVPAFAQIETVVVTAEKKAEDIQTTPIAVTAYSAQDLAAHQVNTFKDIQFSTPNVYYTKTNFTGSNFPIRGIGTQVISGDAENGIAFNIDDVYYAARARRFRPVLRPAIGRSPARPAEHLVWTRRDRRRGQRVLGQAPARRIRGQRRCEHRHLRHDRSEGHGQHADHHRRTRFRVSRPTGSATTATRPMSIRLPTTVIPTPAINGPRAACSAGSRARTRRSTSSSPMATKTTRACAARSSSATPIRRAFSAACRTSWTMARSIRTRPSSTFRSASRRRLRHSRLGRARREPRAARPVRSEQPFVAPAGRRAERPARDQFRLHADDQGPQQFVHAGSEAEGDRLAGCDAGGRVCRRLCDLSGKLHQLAWRGSVRIRSLLRDQRSLCSEAVLGSYRRHWPRTCAGVTTPIRSTARMHSFSIRTFAGTLPTSNFTNNGIIGGSINRYTTNPFAYDQSNGGTKQWSGDLRFNSNFEGPRELHARLLLPQHALQSGDYYVGANTLDYGQTLFGALARSVRPPCPDATPPAASTARPTTTIARTAAASNPRRSMAKAIGRSIRKLKLTLGLRGTEDVKEYRGRITIFNGFDPRRLKQRPERSACAL